MVCACSNPRHDRILDLFRISWTNRLDSGDAPNFSVDEGPKPLPRLVYIYSTMYDPYISVCIFEARGVVDGGALMFFPSFCRWLAFGGAMTSNVAAASRGVLAKVSKYARGE